MYFEYLGPDCRVVLFTIDALDDAKLATLETPCGIAIAPLAAAEVTLYQTGEHGNKIRLVFDAVTGMLPNDTTVVAVKDAEGCFPESVLEVDVRVVFEPFTERDFPRLDRFTAKLATDPCPLCGRAVGDPGPDPGDDDDDDDDEDEDEGGDDPPPVAPIHRFRHHLRG